MTNWQPIATISAPIIAFVIGLVVNRRLGRRPKLISFMANSSAVPVQPPDGQPFNVHTHTVVIRNAGGASANNVRLSHGFLPGAFSVFPSVEYTISYLPSGGADIVFPKIIPGEQVSVTYLYFPPVFVNHVNTNVKSDEGYGKIVNILWSPQAPRWQRRLSTALITLGVIFIVYLIFQSAMFIWPKLVGT